MATVSVVDVTLKTWLSRLAFENRNALTLQERDAALDRTVRALGPRPGKSEDNGRYIAPPITFIASCDSGARARAIHYDKIMTDITSDLP